MGCSPHFHPLAQISIPWPRFPSPSHPSYLLTSCCEQWLHRSGMWSCWGTPWVSCTGIPNRRENLERHHLHLVYHLCSSDKETASCAVANMTTWAWGSGSHPAPHVCVAPAHSGAICSCQQHSQCCAASAEIQEKGGFL